MNKIIRVKNLVKKSKKSETNAVDDISFYAENGAFFAILGTNGAGKTTTISILTTILSETSGQAEIAGYDECTQPGKVSENIDVIFQKPSLDFDLTAEENIRFHTNLYGLYSYRLFYSLMPKDYKEKVVKLSAQSQSAFIR
ncbi:ATP-binding cassette domain-containing protein [Candidatus Woesearchaeota archaeon]|nr:ATP-binding cassette domain-containing protein [Candidatus Woesearchaeota archaeon]